jgi:hypothetical protein
MIAMEIKPPKWYMELERFKAFKTVFIIEGNIYDIHPYPTPTDNGIRWDLLKLDNYLFNYLTSNGYTNIVFYNHIDGFYNDLAPQQLDNFLRLVKGQDAGNSKAAAPAGENNSNRFAATLDKATQMIRTGMDNRQAPLAIIMNLASRYIASPDNLSEEERQFYSRLMLSTLKPRQVRSQISDKLTNNLLFIIANKVNDIPAWFYLDTPTLKTSQLPNLTGLPAIALLTANCAFSSIQVISHRRNWRNIKNNLLG